MISALQTTFDQWITWSKRSVNRRIFAAMITVGGLSIVVKLAATAKHLVVAHQFGTSDALDAFLIAFLLPSFAINVAAGSFNAAFMPTYIQVRERGGREEAQKLFSSVMVWSTILLLVVSAILALLAPYVLPIMGSSFDPEKQAVTRSLFYVTLPVLIISGLATIWASVLNAGERFALAAIVPVVTPVMAVIVLLAMGKFWGIYALAIGTVGGFVLEAGLLAWGLRQHGLCLIPRWHGMSPAMKQVVRQYAPMAAGALLMGGTGIIDQSMAASLGSGSVSALSYGNKVIALMLGIGSMALSTAVFPHFSRMTAVSDWVGVRHTLKTYTRLVLVVTVPCTLIVICFSESIVSLLFERGAFTGADTRLVGQIQALYAIQVPFYVLGIMGVRLLSALTKNQILMAISAINLMTNVFGNYVFMHYMGVIGISLSTSVVYAISMSLIFLSLKAQLRKRELSE